MKMKTDINDVYDDMILSNFYEETWNMFNDYCSSRIFSCHHQEKHSFGVMSYALIPTFSFSFFK